jgi:prepilin-type N-terminal cleavage/methylation domain-containing protein
MKKAFTLLELVFVIVVLGIIAAIAIPRLDRDVRQEAIDNILSAICYTQHLALTDDKTNPFDPNWQQTLWKISFSTSSNNLANFYTISSDLDKDGSVDKEETAIDPSNGQYFYNLGGNQDIDEGESPNIFIGKLYGINSITASGGCSSKHIAFDHFGRAHNKMGTASNNYNTYIQSDCKITMGFTDSDVPNIIFTIQKETGYVWAE